MSTPDDKGAERGQVVPPWKRGEKTASTGITAGEMAKAAAADKDRAGDRPAGPPPRGVVAGDASGPVGPPRPAPTSPPQETVVPTPPKGSDSAAPTTAQPVQSQPGPAKQGPVPSAPAKPVAPQPGAAKPPVPPTASKPPVAPAPAPQAPFVESDTRNIPRNDLARKDELPDLDSIHHVEASRDGQAAVARAQSQTIPSRPINVPLRAAVQIRRVDPWSVFKVTGVLSIVGFFVWMIAVAILYGVLDGMGIWEQINGSFGDILDSKGGSSGSDLIGAGMVFGFSAGFGVVAAIFLTGLATISAYVYNVCSDMVGGIEVTLADLD